MSASAATPPATPRRLPTPGEIDFFFAQGRMQGIADRVAREGFTEEVGTAMLEASREVSEALFQIAEDRTERLARVARTGAPIA